MCISTGSKVIIQSPSELPGALDKHLVSTDYKKKQKERNKEEYDHIDKNTLYDIVSSPGKDSSRLTLKLTRVRSSETDQFGEMPSEENANHLDTSLMKDTQLSQTTQDVSQKSGAEEQENCQQALVPHDAKNTGVVSGALCDDVETDALSESERVEQELSCEKERWNKDVQDKGERYRSLLLKLSCNVLFKTLFSLF